MGIHAGTSGTRELCTDTLRCASGSQEDDISRGEMDIVQELAKLPQDIFDNIYSLLPMQDAARAACVSHHFLCSWKHFPRLVFNSSTLGLDKLKLPLDEEVNHFTKIVDHILMNHSGVGVKKLVLQLFLCPSIDASYLDKWLQIAVKPGIENIVLEISSETAYNFPCSLLSNKIAGATIQSLVLSSCAFHPTAALGWNKSLTALSLYMVRITEEELGQFVSNCLSLVKLSLSYCNDVVSFRAPCPLQLEHLHVTFCEKLHVIEISAPKLLYFVFGENLIRISLGVEVKHVRMVGYQQPNLLFHARTMVPIFMPNVERLSLESVGEIKTPLMPSKFIHLKYLDIYIMESFSGYDYFSLISFLGASPSLETFIFRVRRCYAVCHDSTFGDLQSEMHLRQVPECRYDNLKNVTITGASAAKTMIELASHIVQNASALSSMVMDTARGCGRRTGKTNRCSYMSKEALMEANKTVEAVERFIRRNVPSSANFKVLPPCRMCGVI
ncbi:unnamed protein product [Urochloa decumbens]|uniref:At1g61320/AtMIF1 LRR domain-containing protein n=1 Tax=Urochloa decumbens TaxID=240449 RepID=A0ABC9ERV8_9POAL